MKNQIIEGNEELEPIFLDSLVQYGRYSEENVIPCWDVNPHLVPSIRFSLVDEVVKIVELRNRFDEYLATWDYLNDQIVDLQP